MINTLKQIKTFSFYEKIKMVLYVVSEYIISKTPQGLKSCYVLVIYLKKHNVTINKVSDSIVFSFNIGKSISKFYLKRNSSDSMVFKQIIINKEYEKIIKILKYSISEKPVMIDLGANIGLTTIYLKSFFPEIDVYALEPEVNNFKRLEKNIKFNCLKNVTLLNKGIWSRTTKLKADYSFRDRLDWAFRLVESDQNADQNIDVICMSELMENYSISTIDFLKIDIEGAEKDLFKEGHNIDWLSKVKIIAIEIHDELDVKYKIEKILVKYNFKLQYSGELTIGVNNTLVDSQKNI
jgi:FkbM family methyltransferase